MIAALLVGGGLVLVGVALFVSVVVDLCRDEPAESRTVSVPRADRSLYGDAPTVQFTAVGGCK